MLAGAGLWVATGGLGVFKGAGLEGAACLGLARASFEGVACLGFEAASCSCLGGLGLAPSKVRVDAETCTPQIGLGGRQI